MPVAQHRRPAMTGIEWQRRPGPLPRPRTAPTKRPIATAGGAAVVSASSSSTCARDPRPESDPGSSFIGDLIYSKLDIY